MKNLLILLMTTISFSYPLKAQSPQFAVVKPNGTTQVFPSWTSAYNAASNDDYIYLPGIGITDNLILNKRLHIFGAGHHPDSTLATSKTVISGPINIQRGASGGELNGISCPAIHIGNDNSKVTNFTIKSCYISNYIYFGSSIVDSFPQYITITENVISDLQSLSSAGSINSMFEKNIFIAQVYHFAYCVFKNNIFLLTSNPISGINNSTFENNIFLLTNPFTSNCCFNSYFNNLKLTNNNFPSDQNCPILSENGNISVPNITDIFISYAANGFDYDDDYHLSPACPGNNSGTDGTDVGIYGTSDPTSEGWVPSNPHIYFKDVDPSTGADGKLHIQIGVRANNN